MRYKRNLKPLKNKLDGTAFSPLLILIILFLLIESSLIFKPGVSVQLPSPQSVELPGITGPTLIVGIDRAGQCYFEGKIISGDLLLKQLIRAKEKNPDTTLIIVSDKDARVEVLSSLSALTYQAGLQKILIATGVHSQSALELPPDPLTLLNEPASDKP